MAEPPRRRRSEERDEAILGEPPDVVPEHPRRERPLADDETRMCRRALELDADDAAEHEIADRAAAVPALEPVLLLQQLRLGRGVESLEPFEPGNPRVTVTLLPTALRPVEVRPQLLRVGLAEAESPQPAEALLSVHGSSRQARPPPR